MAVPGQLVTPIDSQVRSSPATPLVRVGTTSGAQCLGTLKQPSYVAQVVPHFGEVQEWQGGFDGTGRKWSQGEVAKAVWELSRGMSIGLRLELDPGDCPGTPLFVREESAPVARLAQPVAEVPRKEQVTEVFHALPAYREIQREYVRQFAEHAEGSGDEVPGAWDHDLLTFEAFRMPGATSTLVSLRSPGDPCGNWSLPKAWVVFDVPDDAASPITVHKPLTQQWSNTVELVLDLEADGKLEYLVRDDLGLGISLVTSGDEALVSWEIDYFDCPC